MSSLFEPLGVTLRQDGELGNTLHAHRVVQYFQESRGEDMAARIVDGLYRRYFSEGRHPSAGDTLVESCVEAGVPEAEAREVVTDESKGEREVKAKIRTVGMDVDAVPVVVVEGKRRDITLTGAKEVSDYVKALQTVIKESA
jgi:predicted DsbA family dithiol-disulfide isomerase